MGEHSHHDRGRTPEEKEDWLELASGSPKLSKKRKRHTGSELSESAAS
jgi:hypothetical protein